MKRKLLFIVLAVVMALACSIGVAACGDDAKFEDGTYDLYYYKYDSASNKEIYVKSVLTFSFKDGTVYCDGKKVGTYELVKKGVNIKFEPGNSVTREKEITFSKSQRGGWSYLGGSWTYGSGSGEHNSELYKQGTAPKNVVDESEYYNQQQ